MEIWKEIKGYEGLYEVSSEGRVRSLDRLVYDKTHRCYRSLKGVILVNRKGQHYYQVNLCKNGIRKQLYVHRLVAETFLSNPDNKPEIDHINTNYLDNRVENLRFVTHTENMNNPESVVKQLGRQKTDEHKRKISESIKGKHWKTIQGKRVWY